jgi:hypothetical protein
MLSAEAAFVLFIFRRRKFIGVGKKSFLKRIAKISRKESSAAI